MYRFIIILSCFLGLALLNKANAQILFAEDCFVGGVTVAGANTSGSGHNVKSIIHWSEEQNLLRAYAITYRYGWPGEFNMYVNSGSVNWNPQNIVGHELLEDNQASVMYATHAQDITESLIITDDTLIIDMPHQDFPVFGNMGWWGIYVVILYESPLINTPVCNRIYITDQRQDKPQTYNFDKPEFEEDTPLALGFFTSRITEFEEDATQVVINNEVVGKIWEYDLTIPPTIGVQGNFYYENSHFEGLNGDTANDRVWRHDAIMKLNTYLTNSSNQVLRMYRVEGGSSNLHPAFLITYTPTCPIPPNTEMPRTHSYCYTQSTPRGQPDVKDTLSFTAIPDYDHYTWTPGKGLSDSTIANPQCFADSSRWYRVSMWNDDEGEACSQTIPVFVTVNQVPRPGNLEIKPSICPANTGKIVFKNMAGKPPFRYLVNGVQRISNIFENLEPGNYDLMVKDAAGCSWDTTVVVPLNPVQIAAFTANPDSGYSPMRVSFINKSIQATDYTWLIDGVPFSNATNTSYTFADTGSFEIALIAHRLDELCADTAYAYIYVAQGLKLIVPNIITPNNDGRNDALVVQTGGVAYMHWEVHNRWGNLLHKGEANRPQDELTLWSPQANEYPDGVYTLVITAEGESGEVKDFVVQISVFNYLR